MLYTRYSPTNEKKNSTTLLAIAPAVQIVVRFKREMI